jgi:hypothetical protein
MSILVRVDFLIIDQGERDIDRGTIVRCSFEGIAHNQHFLAVSIYQIFDLDLNITTFSDLIYQYSMSR